MIHVKLRMLHVKFAVLHVKLAMLRLNLVYSFGSFDILLPLGHAEKETCSVAYVNIRMLDL